MKPEQDFFNLEQVAEICGQSIEAIKTEIFEGYFLTPSYQFRRPILANLYTTTPPPADNDYNPIGEKVLFKSNESVEGFVDIFSCSRHSGKFNGKIELHPNHQRPHPEIIGFLPAQPKLYIWNQSGLRAELELLEPCEISEDKLIVHRAEVERFIRNDHEAMERYEQLFPSSVNASEGILLPKSRTAMPPLKSERPMEKYEWFTLAKAAEIWGTKDGVAGIVRLILEGNSDFERLTASYILPTPWKAYYLKRIEEPAADTEKWHTPEIKEIWRVDIEVCGLIDLYFTGNCCDADGSVTIRGDGTIKSPDGRWPERARVSR